VNPRSRPAAAGRQPLPTRRRRRRRLPRRRRDDALGLALGRECLRDAL